MALLCKSIKLTNKFSLDLVILDKLRDWNDGFAKYKAEYRPSFQFMIVLLNYTLIELDIYNVNHLVDTDDMEDA
jgi:hypothetical protein